MVIMFVMVMGRWSDFGRRVGHSGHGDMLHPDSCFLAYCWLLLIFVWVVGSLCVGEKEGEEKRRGRGGKEKGIKRRG